MSALMLYGMNAVAQKPLTEGWYRFVAKEGTALSSVISGGKTTVQNGETEFRLDATHYYPLKFGVYDVGKAPVSWLYVTPKSGNVYNVRSLDGHYLTSKAASSRTAEQLNILAGGTNSYVTIGDFWTLYNSGEADGARVGGDTGQSDCRYEPIAVTATELAAYDVYTVSITGAAEASEIGLDARVTCTNAANKGIASVYNNGRFIFTAGTTVSASDFKASDVSGYKSAVTVSATNKKVTVTYAKKNNTELLAEVIAEAESTLARSGVGYPKADDAKRTLLATAITVAKAVALPVESDITKLQTALETYCTVTDAGIQMPEDGKVYTLTFRPADKKNGTYRYVNFNGVKLETVATTLEVELPATACFVCHKWMDGKTAKYLLVPAYGKVGGRYLSFQGLSEGYSAGVNDFTVNTLVGVPSTMVTDKSAKNLFGNVYLTFAKRSDTDEQTGVCSISELAGSFGNTTVPRLDGSYTSAVIMREVKGYPNTVTLAAAGNIPGINTIGTFSAPYAALVPEGVKACYVKHLDTDEGESVACTVQLECGKAIPANTGVLLVSTSEEATPVTSAFMVPAAGEERAAVEGNLLSHSAGADKAVPVEENAYVLSKRDGEVAFRQLATDASKRNLKKNKSYLIVPATVGQTTSFRIDFGFDDAAPVRGIRATGRNESRQEVYDISGRRMTGTLKAGIYIQDGKKFIVR